jgi:uncharacterized membrane protein
MQIQSNSRQIPSIERYTADKKYNDLLYGILQEMSYLEVCDNEKVRYVNKKDINYTHLGERMGTSRQTASSKFKNLISLGLIVFIKEQDRYKLNYLDKTTCSLVPFETLRILNNTLSQNSISLYVYLLKRYIANKEQEFTVTMSQMKKFIGIATTTTSNNEIINDILNVLKLLGLVDFNKIQIEKDKTQIQIKKVNNVVKKSC